MAAKPQRTASAGIRTIEKRWGKAAYRHGWVAIPAILLDKQASLGIDPLDMNILLHIARHWWEADRHPWKRKRELAQDLGRVPRTVQRRIADMEKGGLIQRRTRRRADGSTMSNEYDLTPLAKILDDFAAEAIVQREKQRVEKEGLRRKKRPGPRLVEE